MPVARVTAIAKTGSSAFERRVGQQLLATEVVKPNPGLPPNNFRRPCNAGFYLFDDLSEKKVIHAVTQ